MARRKRRTRKADFKLGLNADLSAQLVSGKELMTAKNVILMSRAGCKKRFGGTQKNSVSYAGQVEEIEEWTHPNGSKEKLAVIGSDLCTLAADYSKTVLKTLANPDISYFVFNGNFYFLDGNEYYVYDGTSVSTVTADTSSDCNLTPVRKCRYAIRHPKSNRFFFAGNPDDVGAVYWSEYNDPNYVKDISVLYPQEDEGEVMGFALLLDALLVFYKNDAWVWRGIDPAKDAVWEQIPTSHGTLSEDSLELTSQALITLADAGLYAFGPNVIGVPMGTETESTLIQNIAMNRVMSIIDGITDPQEAVSIYDKKNMTLYLAYCDDGTGRNNKILTYNFKTKGFTIYEGIKVNDFLRLDDNTILAGTENYIIEINTSTSDVNVADGGENVIDFEIKTPPYDFELPYTRKLMNFIYIKYKNFGTNQDINIDIIVDGEQKETYTITGNTTSREILTHRKKTSYKGNNFQLKLYESAYSELEIYELGFEYTPIESDGDLV